VTFRNTGAGECGRHRRATRGTLQHLQRRRYL